MMRTLSAILACTFLASSSAVLAWDVKWSNHRSIKVHIGNLYADELRVLGYGYQCVNNKPEPVNVPPNGGKGTAEFEWKGTDCPGTQWMATLAIGVRGAGTQICVINLTAEKPNLNGDVKSFQAKTDHSSNCKIDISADPKDPRDNITVRVAATAIPREPESRPSSTYWWDSNCRGSSKYYAPMCSTAGGGMIQGDNCNYYACRKCPDGKEYYFIYSFLQTDAQSNVTPCP